MSETSLNFLHKFNELVQKWLQTKFALILKIAVKIDWSASLNIKCKCDETWQ